MFLLNVPTFYQYVAKGFILLLAVVMDITARKNKR
jgi:ABC-type xylose transport system permease subunit